MSTERHQPRPVESDEVLSGGNTSDRVIRVGGTVRKPWTAATPNVIAYTEALASAGIEVPRSLGRDERGRHVLEFVPGPLAMHSAPLSLGELGRVGAMVRAIHDASEAYRAQEDAVWDTAIAPPGDDLVCHNDLAPWNLLVGDRWLFIDWDAAAPSTRAWDLAYAAQAFTLSDSSEEPADAARRLGAFVDGYGADPALRAALPESLRLRTEAMHDLLADSAESGVEPWATMFSTGHGAHWRAAADYVARNREIWTRALS